MIYQVAIVALAGALGVSASGGKKPEVAEGFLLPNKFGNFTHADLRY